MNREDIFNGITGIRDDQISEAAHGRKRSRNRRLVWMSAVAACLVVVLVTVNIWNPSGRILTAYAIAQAEYPKQEEHRDAWKVEKKDEAIREYKGTLAEFEKTVVPGLLSGTEGENRICSPLNVYMALSMLTELTDGESRTQILKLLDCDSMETARSRADALWNVNYKDDKTVCLLANSLWLNKNIPFEQRTMDTLAVTYHASSFQGEMGSAGYDRALRSWVNQNTGGHLKEQAAGLSLKPASDDLAVMTLLSTVYFRAKWNDAFKSRDTEPGTFHAPDKEQTVDFMHQTEDGNYYWGEKFSAAEKSLEGSGSMWFLLPDEGVSPEDLLSDEDALLFLTDREKWENPEEEEIAQFLTDDTESERSKYMKINFLVPKFDVRSNLDLAKSLQKLGITDVFQTGIADFSPMLAAGKEEELSPYISEVRHAVRVTIDEEGCEAASYIEIPGAGAAAPASDTVDFVLDRPFLFAITSADGSLLYAGIVNRP